MMNPLLIKNYTAGGTVNAYRILKFGSADGEVVQASAASDALIGVSNSLSATSGQRVDVIHTGIAEVEYGGSITRGACLTADSNGKAVTAATNQAIIGRAVVSGASGDIGSVILQLGVMYIAGA
jgi:hypothetical protein